MLIFFSIMMKKWLLKNIKARVQKPYPIYDQNGRNQLKSIPYLWPKRLKNHTLWGRTYLYSPYKGVPPPPGGWPIIYCSLHVWCEISRYYKQVKSPHCRCNLSPVISEGNQIVWNGYTCMLILSEETSTSRFLNKHWVNNSYVLVLRCQTTRKKKYNIYVTIFYRYD